MNTENDWTTVAELIDLIDTSGVVINVCLVFVLNVSTLGTGSRPLG